jgi:hypothetical protein
MVETITNQRMVIGNAVRTAFSDKESKKTDTAAQGRQKSKCIGRIAQ